MMDIRLLRAFIVVAETENVGQAAERLFISQSPLSRQIMQLEAQLELKLFERSRQRIRLTDEGRLFLAEARSLLAQAAQLEAHARQLARGETGTLAIGYVEASMHNGSLPDALTRMKARRPKAGISLHLMRSAAQIEALSRRTIDVGLLYSPPEDPYLSVMEIHSEPVLLAMAVNHPLADRLDVQAGDLDGLPWVALTEALNPQARRRFLQNCRSCSFTPDIQMDVDNLLAVLRLVNAGLGVTFIQSSLRDVLPDGLVFRDIPWFPSSVTVYAAWRKDDPKPLLVEFRQALLG